MSAKAPRLQIIIDADGKLAVKELKGVSESVEGVDSAAKGAKGGMASFRAGLGSLATAAGIAVAGIVAAGIALREIGEFVQLGLDSQRAGIALEAMSGGAQMAADALDAVKAASNGALTDLEATEAATRFFSMGLVDTADEAARLTRIAITLGATMGMGPQQSIENLTLMLANQSILRLDSYGVSGAAVRDRMDELAASSQDAGRETNFMTAFLEEAEPKMVALEEAGFEATSSLDELTAMLEDAKTAGAELVAGALLPIAAALVEGKKAHDEARQAGMETYATWNETVAQHGTRRGVALQAYDQIRANEELAESYTYATRAGDMLGRGSIALVGDLSEVGIEMGEARLAAQAAAAGSVAYVAATEEMSKSTRGLSAAEEAMKGWTNKGRDFSTEARQMRKDILALPDLRETQFLQGMDAADALFAAGIISSQALDEELAALTESFKAGDAFEDFDSTLDDTTAAGGEVKGVLMDINTEIGLFSGQHTANLYIDVHGEVPSFNKSGGISRKKGCDGMSSAFRSGADFIVPPGFANDSFPMRVESGEHVKVTPAADVAADVAAGKAGSGLTINVSGNIYGEMHLQDIVMAALQQSASGADVYSRMR